MDAVKPHFKLPDHICDWFYRGRPFAYGEGCHCFEPAAGKWVHRLCVCMCGPSKGHLFGCFGLVLVTGREEKGQNRVIYCVCVFDGDKKGLGCPGFVSKSQVDGFPDGRRTREAGSRVDPGLAGVR